MNADRIAEIRERLDKATPGPWGTMHARPEDKKMSAIWSGSIASGALAYVGAEWTDAVADAELIAHARDDLAFLLDLVALVSSGEVETPCPTCGGTGHDGATDPDGVPNPNFCKTCKGTGRADMNEHQAPRWKPTEKRAGEVETPLRDGQVAFDCRSLRFGVA